jgi:hypothetical protein
MLVTRSTTIGIHREKIEADQELARQKFEYDRQQAIFKRRFELAEQLLSDGYRLRSTMSFVRNGVAFNNEGSTREALGYEPDDIKHRRDVYFVPLERLNRENDFISTMFARRATCQALLGPKAEEAFSLLQGAIHKVRVASSLLVEWTKEHSQIDVALIRKLEGDIWEPMGDCHKSNEISDNINKAIALLEEVCGPVLAWVDKP